MGRINVGGGGYLPGQVVDVKELTGRVCLNEELPLNNYHYYGKGFYINETNIFIANYRGVNIYSRSTFKLIQHIYSGNDMGSYHFHHYCPSFEVAGNVFIPMLRKNEHGFYNVLVFIKQETPSSYSVDLKEASADLKKVFFTMGGYVYALNVQSVGEYRQYDSNMNLIAKKSAPYLYWGGAQGDKSQIYENISTPNENKMIKSAFFGNGSVGINIITNINGDLSFDSQTVHVDSQNYYIDDRPHSFFHKNKLGVIVRHQVNKTSHLITKQGTIILPIPDTNIYYYNILVDDRLPKVYLICYGNPVSMLHILEIDLKTLSINSITESLPDKKFIFMSYVISKNKLETKLFFENNQGYVSDYVRNYTINLDGEISFQNTNLSYEELVPATLSQRNFQASYYETETEIIGIADSTQLSILNFKLELK